MNPVFFLPFSYNLSSWWLWLAYGLKKHELQSWKYTQFPPPEQSWINLQKQEQCVGSDLLLETQNLSFHQAGTTSKLNSEGGKGSYNLSESFICKPDYLENITQVIS